MKTGVYTLKEFLTDHNLDQIVIPEIQRDYVWRSENVENLLNSIKLNADRENALSAGASEEALNSLPPELRSMITRELKNNRNYCNVGFIYAYYDADLPGKFMLIDGQQRLTTLFLLLLCLSINEGKQETFKRAYFKNGVLKLDYKVRENAHNFMYRFVEYLLNGNATKDIPDQYWYFSEYQDDATINSLIENYNTIVNFAKTSHITLQYVEEYLEFWYFDTKESKQGEELYIYMNSRGESVSSGESLKAALLNGLSEDEKHHWGAKWEEWQNFFWANKGSNPNSDKGLEEFLRWIKIIEAVKTYSSPIMAPLELMIRNIRSSTKISPKGISFQMINEYFDALQRIVLHRKQVNFNQNWLSANLYAIDYMKFLPAIYFADTYPDATDLELKRISRLFLNTTRFEDVAKTPIESLVTALTITKSLLAKGYRDIADLISLPDNSAFDNLLTLEEKWKLSSYKNVVPDFRQQVEKVFWIAEDHKLLEGKITFLWDCINFDPKITIPDQNILSQFEEAFSHFKVLFENVDDVLRRSLLTKGDYSLWHGRTATLSGDRYSFIGSEATLRIVLHHHKTKLILKNLLTDYTLRARLVASPVKHTILEGIITDYHTTATKKDWIYYFVKYPEIFRYCGKKLVCFQDNQVGLDKIILLQSQKAGDYNWQRLGDTVAFEE